MEQVWQDIIHQVISFGLIGGFLFFRKYFEEFGKQGAKLKFTKKKTAEIEEAKYPFNQALEEIKASHNKELEAVKALHSKELEAVKASLNKENIAYQIHNEKYVEFCFQRLDELHGKMYELKKYCQDNLKMFFNPADKEVLQDKITKFYEHHRIAEDALRRAFLYIADDKLYASAVDFLNKNLTALQKFRTFYYGTVPHSSKTQPQEPIYLRDINDQPLVDMLFSVDELSDFLSDIEKEIKRYLTNL